MGAGTEPVEKKGHKWLFRVYIDDEIQPGQLYRDYNKLGGGFKYFLLSSRNLGK